MSWEELKTLAKSIPPVHKTYRAIAYALIRTGAGAMALKEILAPPVSDDLPIPPPMLRLRVHGALGAEMFLKVGSSVAGDIHALLASVGKEFGAFPAVLDFGCGCGRVLRHFIRRTGSCRLHGTDIDAEAISWCTRNLRGMSVTFGTNGCMPPTKYPDGAFDFIYAISVFTHLDERYQNAWLAEMKRILKKGGILLATVHGALCQGGLAEKEKAAMERDGFLYRVESTGRLKIDGLPDFYQVAFHTEEYVRRQWPVYFRVLRYVEGGVNGLQDAVVLKNE